jgi:predicted DCC family thiol-disulfide oxidoreductase YuxK
MSNTKDQPATASPSRTETVWPQTSLSNESAPVDTLFFDGQCPLCAGEIAQLRKVRGAALRIVDIHGLEQSTETSQSCEESLAPAPDKDQLLRVLHLRRADGTWLTSADANVAAWEGTRHGQALKVLRWPLIRPVADVIYALWARWRYRRLYGRQFSENLHAPER